MSPLFPEITFFAGDPMAFPTGNYGDGKKPQMCPVCEGKGIVPAGFYLSSGSTVCSPEPCRACDGRGIIIC